MMDIWIFFAVMAALGGAALSLSNDFFKVSALYFSFWLRLFVLLALLPFVFIFSWPEDPLYYVFVATGAIIFSYFDLRYFGLAAKNGAGVMTRIDPLTVMATFILWCLISPSLTYEYFTDPWRSAGILAALGGAVFFGLRLRHCEISRDTLRQMAFPIMLSAIGALCSKMAMDRSGYHEGVIFYVFIQCAIVVAVLTAIIKIPVLADKFRHAGQADKLMDRRVIFAGFCGALAWLSHTPAKHYAFADVENPAYVTMIGLTAPLWVLLVYRAIGRKEQADILSGLGVVFCAALLVALTQF